MKILLLCNKSPYPAVEGGPLAMDATIRGLVDEGHELSILTTDSEKFPAVASSIPQELREKISFSYARIDLSIKPLQALINLVAGQSYHAARFYSQAFSAALTSILRNDYDIIQLESVYMGVYLSLIRKQTKAPVILRAHNVEHQIWSRLADNEKNPVKRYYLRHLTAALSRFERTISRDCDAIAAITPEDKEWFVTQTENPVIVIPFSVDTDRWKNLIAQPETASVGHLGAMSWWPNEEGIRWFMEEVWPLIHGADRTLKLHLAGRSMPAWLKTREDQGIIVHGEVARSVDFISQHPIMIIPLQSGSGMRVKMVEGMLAGRAIVSTRVGAEGIPLTPGKQALIADHPREFAQAVVSLASDPARCMRIGKDAHIFALEAFDRSVQSRKLTHLYETLKSRS